MKRIIIVAVLAVASIEAHASCMSIAGEADNIATMRDYGTSAADMKAIWRKGGQYNEPDMRFENEIVDRIYSTKVKPWNATALANSVCNPQQTADDSGLSEKQRETNYRDTFNRIQSIPGICTGDDCKRVVKIQKWDANTGAMLN
jgi:hypothetical protein